MAYSVLQEYCPKLQPMSRTELQRYGKHIKRTRFSKDLANVHDQFVGSAMSGLNSVIIILRLLFCSLPIEQWAKCCRTFIKIGPMSMSSEENQPKSSRVLQLRMVTKIPMSRKIMAAMIILPLLPVIFCTIKYRVICRHFLHQTTSATTVVIQTPPIVCFVHYRTKCLMAITSWITLCLCCHFRFFNVVVYFYLVIQQCPAISHSTRSFSQTFCARKTRSNANQVQNTAM